MLKYPYNIGRIYEKVAKTSRAEIHRIYKSAAELPNIQEQYSIASRNRSLAIQAEAELNAIKRNLLKYPNMDVVKKALVTGISTSSVSESEKSKILELAQLRASGSKGKTIINLSDETGPLVAASEKYVDSVYEEAAARQKKEFEEAKQLLARDIVNKALSGAAIPAQNISIKPKTIIPSDSINEIELKDVEEKSKFIQHYEQIIDPTESLTAIYEKAIEYEDLRKIEMASSYATHYKNNLNIKKI